MKPIQEIFPLLTAPRKVVITMHQKPDADAMGSSLGLYHFLIQFGHAVQVISPTNWPYFLGWMPGCEHVMDYESNPAAAKKELAAADWVFCLDYNHLGRTKNMAQPIAAVNAERILIDHHQEPDTERFSYGISDTTKSSTAEMVYRFIYDSGYEERINADVAACLYAGVMTDTGSFRFPSTTASVHRMVADLKERGLEHSIIHEHLYDNFLEERYRFIGHVLSHRMEIFYPYNAALISIPQSDLIRFNITTGDTEGLVNYPLSIRGIRLAAIIIDRGEERKSSFRSKGNFDVNTFARKYFNGGGHFNAAGGQSKESLDEVVRIFHKALEENKAQLSSYHF